MYLQTITATIIGINKKWPYLLSQSSFTYDLKPPSLKVPSQIKVKMGKLQSVFSGVSNLLRPGGQIRRAKRFLLATALQTNISTIGIVSLSWEIARNRSMWVDPVNFHSVPHREHGDRIEMFNRRIFSYMQYEPSAILFIFNESAPVIMILSPRSEVVTNIEHSEEG